MSQNLYAIRNASYIIFQNSKFKIHIDKRRDMKQLRSHHINNLNRMLMRPHKFLHYNKNYNNMNAQNNKAKTN